MRLTQGTFSYLPSLSDQEIRAQIQYAINNGWSLAVEFTDDPHPRNVYWEMWNLPMFDLEDAQTALQEANRCRAAHPDDYIRVTAYDPTGNRQTTALSFIVSRPTVESGFRLDRHEGSDRRIHYSLHPNVRDLPGSRA